MRRLEELNLARDGIGDWFQPDGGITDEQAQDCFGRPFSAPLCRRVSRERCPPRLALLTREVWKREIYSEGQLARLLRLDRHGIREVLDGAEREESEADDLVKILR